MKLSVGFWRKLRAMAYSVEVVAMAYGVELLSRQYQSDVHVNYCILPRCYMSYNTEVCYLNIMVHDTEQQVKIDL